MKKVLLSALVLGMVLGSCKKDDETKAETTTPTTTTTVTTGTANNACSGGDGFCMTYKGTQKGGDAKIAFIQSNKFRVFWDEGVGTTFEQVELDIYALDTGTFQVNDLATPNSAFVQYYSQSGGVNNSEYGTVTVSSFDTINGVTGTFVVTMKDSTKITDGKFTNIKK